MQQYASVSSMKNIQNNKLLNSVNQSRQTKANDDPNKKREIKEIILDQHHVDNKIDVSQFNRLFNSVGKNYLETEKEKLWKQRTNQPYKNITPIDNFKKDYENPDDLVIHKVDKNDKDIKLFKRDETTKRQQINDHNHELRDKYSNENLSECKKEFEYNHIKKYNVKYDPTSFEEMKGDIVSYYKHEQQEQEKDKKNIDDVIETMMAIDETSKESTKEKNDDSKTENITDEKQQETNTTNDIVNKYKMRQKKV